MISRFGRHFRHHLVGYLALFIVLGGTAAALPGKGSVRSKDIARNAVKTKHIARNAVKARSIANKAVTGSKLANGAVTASKSSGLIEGDGGQSMVSFTVDAVGYLPNPKPVLASVPTMGNVEILGCFGAPDYDIQLRMRSFDDAQPFFAAGTVTYSEAPSGSGPAAVSDQDAGIFSGGAGTPLIAKGSGGLGTAAHWDWTLSRGTGNGTTGAGVSVDGLHNHGIGGPEQCTVTATTEVQR